MVLFHRCENTRVTDARVNTLLRSGGKACFEFICVMRSVIQHQLPPWRASYYRGRLLTINGGLLCPQGARSFPLGLSVSPTKVCCPCPTHTIERFHASEQPNGGGSSCLKLSLISDFIFFVIYLVREGSDPSGRSWRCCCCRDVP